MRRLFLLNVQPDSRFSRLQVCIEISMKGRLLVKFTEILISSSFPESINCGLFALRNSSFQKTKGTGEISRNFAGICLKGTLLKIKNESNSA